MSTWQQTPLALDPYSRLMAAAFDESEIIGVPTAFQSWFGRPGYGATFFSPVASVVDIDIIRGNKKTAAMVPRGMISRPLGTTQRDTSATKYTSFSRRFPLSLEEGAISADQLEFRGAGENPYAPPADHLTRVRALALRHHKEQIRRTIRMFERLAAQSILTGVQDAILGTSNTDEQYDFVRKATHTFAASGSWQTAATDIMGDLDAGCELIREDANVMPDFLLCSEEAIQGMLKNTALLAFADNRRIGLLQAGSLNAPPMKPAFQRMVDGGLIHRGFVETPAGFRMDVFTYLDTYTNNAGTAVKYMTADTALIGSSSSICDRYFGPPERLPLSPTEQNDMRFYMGVDPAGGMLPPNIKGAGDVISPAMFFFDFYKSGRKEFTVETQSAPIFSPTMTDAWATIDVT